MPILTGGRTLGTGLGTPFTNAGAPVTDTTFVGQAVNGALLLDTTNNLTYQASNCTATTVTWTKVGLQT